MGSVRYCTIRTHVLYVHNAISTENVRIYPSACTNRIIQLRRVYTYILYVRNGIYFVPSIPLPPPPPPKEFMERTNTNLLFFFFLFFLLPSPKLLHLFDGVALLQHFYVKQNEKYVRCACKKKKKEKKSSLHDVERTPPCKRPLRPAFGFSNFLRPLPPK